MELLLKNEPIRAKFEYKVVELCWKMQVVGTLTACRLVQMINFLQKNIISLKTQIFRQAKKCPKDSYWWWEIQKPKTSWEKNN